MNQNGRPMTSPVNIIGLGAVTPFGKGVASFWRAIEKGRDAFDTIRVFPHDHHRTHVAAEVFPAPDIHCRRLNPDHLTRADLFSLTASREALSDAQLMDNENGRVLQPDRMALVLGTAAGAILGLETYFRKKNRGQTIENPRKLVSSFCLSGIGTNIALEFGIKGPRFTAATVCSSSGLALAMAKELLQTGGIDHVLVVGTETLSEVTLAGFNILRSVAPGRCRPFDLNRQGLVLGEGSGAMVLARRGQNIISGRAPIAVLSGYGLLTDIHHFTAPEPGGGAIAETIQRALKDAALGGDAIDYVNAHGTATDLNDVAETKGLKSALGTHARKIRISSTKSMIGHTLGAASILEAIATVLGLQKGVVPPTANLDHPDPECDLNYTPQKAVSVGITRAVSNSFAFGGSNISLVFEKSSPPPNEAVPADTGYIPVITGIGLVSPFGVGKENFIKGLSANEEGLVPMDSVDKAWQGIKGGLIDKATVRKQIPLKIRRRLNTLACIVFSSLQEALGDANISAEEDIQAMVYGSAFGCSENVHNFYTQMLTDGPQYTSPREFNFSVTNAPPSLVAQNMGIRSPIWVIVSDEASWDMSLRWAAGLIATGRAERIAVCAAEEITASVLDIHQALGIISKSGKGLILGEGGVCMIMESKDSAEKRGAPVYGSIRHWHSVQDTACGPLDYSDKAEHLMKAISACLASDPSVPGEILMLSPENGVSALKNISGEIRRRLQEFTQGPIFVSKLRLRIGESGFASGAGMASILLNADGGSPTNSLILTSAKGGVNTATLVNKRS
jgi:3-oxoacyl-[acyl-carrier-protein] synthase II